MIVVLVLGGLGLLLGSALKSEPKKESNMSVAERERAAREAYEIRKKAGTNAGHPSV